jgi:hypothetical protein
MPAFLNFLIPPALLVVSIPLAGFAVLTTLLACTTLFIRASIVYFDLLLALLRSALFSTQSRADGNRAAAMYHREHRRTNRSNTSLSSSSTSSFQFDHPRSGPKKSDSFLSLIGTGSPTRDYEGVGGWRRVGEDSEEDSWMGINSRLELPTAAVGTNGGTTTSRRHHRRSYTGSSQKFGESMRMSPVASRQRSPSGSILGGGTIKDEDLGYFGQQHHLARRRSGIPVMQTSER